MPRRPEPPSPRASRMWLAVQWILLILFGLVALLLGVVLVIGIIVAVRDSAMDRYGIPLSLTAGLFLLFVFLTRNRVYRLIGKEIPPGSGGGIYP